MLSFYSNKSLRFKLLSGFAIVCVTSAALGLFLLQQQAIMKKRAIDDLYEVNHKNVVAALSARAAIITSGYDMRKHMLSDDKQE